MNELERNLAGNVKKLIDRIGNNWNRVVEATVMGTVMTIRSRLEEMSGRNCEEIGERI